MAADTAVGAAAPLQLQPPLASEVLARARRTVDLCEQRARTLHRFVFVLVDVGEASCARRRLLPGNELRMLPEHVRHTIECREHVLGAIRKRRALQRGEQHRLTVLFRTQQRANQT